jgi:circadian clock protein KaiC
MDNPLRPAPLARVSTGVAGLDQLLRGGFLRGGLYLIAGPPGAGKTIAGNQMCFHHVAAGGRALFITLLTESHSRLLAHLATLRFFDPAPIGETLHYFSGYGTLAAEGLGGLITLLRRTMHEHKATLIVLDGLLNVEASAESPLALRQFLHDLQTYAEMSGCTAVLLAHIDSELRPRPEHTAVDGVVALSSHRIGMRALREIEVWKLRGSGFVEGRHAFTIADNGITVYPRTEMVLDSQPFNVAREEKRQPFGITQLDAMLRGGVLRGSATMIMGPTGSGKTLLGLHFLAAGAQANERGLYFGLHEPPPDLMTKADKVGMALSDCVAKGQIVVQWHPVIEHGLDVLAAKLLQAVAEQRIQRIFLDGIQSLQVMTVYPERLSRFLTALSNELRLRGVTAMYAIELRELVATSLAVPMEEASALADTLILLRQVELRSQLYRLLSILKVRASDYDSAIREFQITSQGIEVAATFESADAILTGVARTTASSDDA